MRQYMEDYELREHLNELADKLDRIIVLLERLTESEPQWAYPSALSTGMAERRDRRMGENDY